MRHVLFPRWWILIGALALGASAVMSCRNSDVRTVRIEVPDMIGKKAVRIVTNAALDEISGRYDRLRHGYDVDLAKGLVLYHESSALLAPPYQRRIEARIQEVGFQARVVSAGLNPSSPINTVDGPIREWPDRFTAVIAVANMMSCTDANIVVDAIAYARLGKDNDDITVDPASRVVVARYESLRLAMKNIEYAIACVGFTANDVQARLGAQDALPHGWTPVMLPPSAANRP